MTLLGLIAAATATVIAGFCFFQVHDIAWLNGFNDGLEQGSLRTIKDFCEGSVEIREGKLVFNQYDREFGFFDADGNRIREIDIDKLSFYEDD